MNIIEKIENLPDFIFETAPEEFSRMVRLEDVRAIIEEYKNAQEPFGYFKAEPFGWTDCAETDEGAIALYENPPLSDETVKDAERYRWLRSRNDGNNGFPFICRYNGAFTLWNGLPVDEAIDEAMKAYK